MDRDGIAAEVIFHGSQNGEPMPFLPQLLGNNASFDIDPVLAPVGERIYNRWLADFCSVEPERHVGLAHVPMWDIDAAVREVEWAAEAGLRGVNFPAPRHGVYLEYNDRAWEPFWSACQACGMTLATHVGVASPGRASGPEALALTSIEDGGYFARRAIWWMIFGGVFERHRDLHLVITESPGEWWTHTMVELDSTWLSQADWNAALREQVPRRPSEYCASNVFVGASFLAPFEAARAVDEGYASQLLWGSDYPHIEGTWQYPAGRRRRAHHARRAAQHLLRDPRRRHAGDARRERGAGVRARRVQLGRRRRQDRGADARGSGRAHRVGTGGSESDGVPDVRRLEVTPDPNEGRGQAMDDTQVLADKAEIVELMTRYCFAVDFRDFDALRTVFATDAEATYVLSPLGLGLDDVHLSGADAIVEWLSSVLGNLGEPAPRHAMTNYLIEIHGDHAHSRNYLASGGLYTVDHVRTPDGWRAARWEMRNFPRPTPLPG